MVVLIFAENFCAQTHIEAESYAQELYMACEHHNTKMQRNRSFL